jgi:hypothetical protein
LKVHIPTSRFFLQAALGEDGLLELLKNEDDICPVGRWKGSDEPVTSGFGFGECVVDYCFEIGDLIARRSSYFDGHDVG